MNAATASIDTILDFEAKGRPGQGPLELSDYIADDGRLRVRHDTKAGYRDPAPGSLFAHPVWLRAYGTDEIVVVDGLWPDVPRLVFTLERGGLIHCGRLLRFQATLVAGLTDRLLASTGTAFLVFEDVEIIGALPTSLLRVVLYYQNNWRLNLRDPAWSSRRLVSSTKRKARGLKRDLPDVSIRFDAAPGRSVLDRIASFGRARIEAKGRRYGIDAAELDRLMAVSDDVGHGTLVRSGDAILAADLVCVVGNQAYFLTHGFDPDYPRSRLGMVCLVNSIEGCAARGIRDFNMLWGDLPYKAQLGAERVALQTVVACRSWASLVSPGYLAVLLRYGWYDFKRRLKPQATRIRALFRRSTDPSREAD